jgi:hypothetical protein
MPRVLLSMVALGASLALAVSVAARGISATPHRVTSASKKCAWRVVDDPKPGEGQELTGVDSSSSTNVWAIGRYWTSPSELPTTYLQRWDGRQWELIDGPADEKDADYFDIEVVSQNDVWIIGADDSEFVAHWNGSAWSLRRFAGAYLDAIGGRSTNDVWAVGQTDSEDSLAMHWNGRTWTKVAVPWKRVTNPGATGAGAGLWDVVVTRNGGVWALGSRVQGNPPDQTVTAVLRWTGTRWVRTPDRPLQASRNEAIAASSDSDAWVVGARYLKGSPGPGGFATHWNGLRWSYTRSARPGMAELFAVAATSSKQAWAAGGSNGGNAVLIKRWNGTRWEDTIVPTKRYATIKGLSAISASDVWAVGSTDETQRSLIAHFSCGYR